MAAAPQTRSVPLANGFVADVLVKGTGTPLLFLHPAQGRVWAPFLDGLAETYTVYAPQTPGYDEPADLLNFDGFSDLSLFYDDLLNALDIETAVIVGHGFGGMAAAEFAAHHPARVERLVLIGALGLWQEETPVADIHTTHPSELGALLFSDPDSAAAALVLSKPTPQDRLDYQLALGAACHFYWPIPDRDLKRRLYRITAPTLLLWGGEDRVVPPLYAGLFAAGLPVSQTVIVPGAGHFPHLEQAEAALKAVAAFAGQEARSLAAAG